MRLFIAAVLASVLPAPTAAMTLHQYTDIALSAAGDRVAAARAGDARSTREDAGDAPGGRACDADGRQRGGERLRCACKRADGCAGTRHADKRGGQRELQPHARDPCPYVPYFFIVLAW